MPSPPPADLTERQARFEALYAGNHAAIFGYALRRTASPDDAADILAETFLTAWRRLDELPLGNLPPGDLPPGDLPPGELPPGELPPGDLPPGELPPGELPPDGEARMWLYGVARRVLANQRRGERRRSALADRLHAELPTRYDVPPEFDAESAKLAEALRRLPPRLREVLALNAWEGLDYGEIATVLGCSRNAVRIRLHRARTRLAAELGGPSDTRSARLLGATFASEKG